MLGATTYKEKYLYLIDKLQGAGLLEATDNSYVPAVMNEELEILYIQPHLKEGDNQEAVIDFNIVADALEQQFKGDAFMFEAANSFRAWYQD